MTFCATLPVITKKNHRRFTRIVTLPDYQGMGIGMRVVAAVASLHRAEGLRINVTSSHPALIRHCKRSPSGDRQRQEIRLGPPAAHGSPSYRSPPAAPSFPSNTKESSPPCSEARLPTTAEFRDNPTTTRSN